MKCYPIGNNLGTEYIPSGKRLHNYGKSPFSMGKSTISTVIFNSYVSLRVPEASWPADLQQIWHAMACLVLVTGKYTRDPMTWETPFGNDDQGLEGFQGQFDQPGSRRVLAILFFPREFKKT